MKTMLPENLSVTLLNTMVIFRDEDAQENIEVRKYKTAEAAAAYADKLIKQATAFI